jgi:hypothetical protein
MGIRKTNPRTNTFPKSDGSATRRLSSPDRAALSSLAQTRRATVLCGVAYRLTCETPVSGGKLAVRVADGSIRSSRRPRIALRRP